MKSHSPELEIESTFLAKSVPAGLAELPHSVIEDVYFPASAHHASLRIRYKDDAYTLTKKVRVDPNDASQQNEYNIPLTAEEYAALAAGNGRRLSKTRYYFEHSGYTAELDVFDGPLKGLVVVEFEFPSQEARANFAMPGFCLADVTQEEFIAGGLLAGKKYADIDATLAGFGYTALHVETV